MKKAIHICLSVLAFSCFFCTSCRRDKEPNDCELPLSFSEFGLPTVIVEIADTAIPFVVDTGANRSLLSAEMAGGLELPPICSRGSIQIVIKHEPVSLTHVHDVSCTIAHHRFVLKTLLIAEMPSGDPNAFCGLLGMDFLQSTRAVIDIEGSRLLIRKTPDGNIEP